MKKKLKIYVLILSKVFPVKHPKKGEPTYFAEHLKNALEIHNQNFPMKLHTMRSNYEWWQHVFDEINKGEACLSIRQWSGKPRASKQIEIARLTKDDGIGLQKVLFSRFSDGAIYMDCCHIDGKDVQGNTVAHNDGLPYNDWLAWFKQYDLNDPLAVIQFTKFRY